MTGGSGHTGQAVLPPFSGERLAHGGERVIHGGERPPHKGERATQGGECAAHSRKRSAHNSERSAHSSERPAHAGELSVHSSERASHAGERADQSGERPVHDGERAAHALPGAQWRAGWLGRRGGHCRCWGGRGRRPSCIASAKSEYRPQPPDDPQLHGDGPDPARVAGPTAGIGCTSRCSAPDQVARFKAQGRSMEYIREYFVQLDAS